MLKLDWRRNLLTAAVMLVVVVIGLVWLSYNKPELPVATIPSPAVLPVVTLIPTPQSSMIGNEQENAEFGKTVQAIDYDYDSMLSYVIIQPDSDPRLSVGNKISTLVSLRDETYTIFFQEAMDRNSVIEALTRIDPDNSSRLYPKLLIHWTDDRQLHVKVLATQTTGWDFYSSRYHIELGGAKSASGNELNLEDNRFIATVQLPDQLWRFSVDGQKKEKLTHFTVPYNIIPLDDKNQHFLLSRAAHYCGCDDANYPAFYSTYDMEQDKLTHYHLRTQLTTNYRGKGSFIADTRGFFLKEPNVGFELPDSDSSHSIQLDEFVFGASFSKDHESIILAVGDQEQTKDFDLMILNLRTDEQQRYSRVITGSVPENMMSGDAMPITIKDDGKRIYFRTKVEGADQEEVNHYYDWETKKVVVWQPPDGVTGWSGFTQSSDDVFRLYANGGLYKNNQRVETPFDMMNYYGGFWIPDTHLYVVIDRVSDMRWIVMLDADTLEFTTIAESVSDHVQLKSLTSDGKWITATLRDEPQLRITSGEQDIVGINLGKYNHLTREELEKKLEPLMKDNSWEELPYVALDETITIEAENFEVEELVVDDYLLTSTGTILYGKESVLTSIIPVNEEKATFTLSANLLVSLSSKFEVYKPGNTVRCFVIRSNRGDSSFAYAFILRTDANNNNSEVVNSEKGLLNLNFEPIVPEALKKAVPPSEWTKAQTIKEIAGQKETSVHLFSDATLKGVDHADMYAYLEFKGHLYLIGMVGAYGLEDIRISAIDRTSDGVEEIEITGGMGASYEQMIMIYYDKEKDVWTKLVEMGSPETVDLDMDGNVELIVTSRGSLPGSVEIYRWNNSQFEMVDVAQDTGNGFARLHIKEGQFAIEIGNSGEKDTHFYRYDQGKLVNIDEQY